MSAWNYRVMRRSPSPSFSGDAESVYEIVEVYYNSEGKVTGWTESGSRPLGLSVEELRRDLDLMQVAFSKEVLDEASLELDCSEASH